MEKLFFLFKSIDLDPKIKISNISASRCPIFMILGSLNLSRIVLARSSDNSYIYYKSIISTFKDIQRTTQGQTKMLHLLVLGLLTCGLGVHCKYFLILSYVLCLLVCYFLPRSNQHEMYNVST